jgi:hypothetical protein
MAAGQLITAARFNAMQAKVARTLGFGDGEFGYGQSLNSLPVSANTDIVEASDMNNLRLDLIDTYVHQTGSIPSLDIFAIGDEVGDAELNQYETIANYLFNNKNDIFESTQASVESKLLSVRNTQWGGNAQPQTVYHAFKVTFSNADQRRHFFNAGGEIRFTASVVGGSGSKTSTWAAMLSSMGTIKFNYNTVTASSGLSANIGNFDLTSNYQTIYTKVPSGMLYSNNNYIIRAKGAQTSNIIEFSIEFFDGINNSVDEPVTGTLSSSVSQLRPTGIYVEVPTPVYTVTQLLS